MDVVEVKDKFVNAMCVQNNLLYELAVRNRKWPSLNCFHKIASFILTSFLLYPDFLVGNWVRLAQDLAKPQIFV